MADQCGSGLGAATAFIAPWTLSVSRLVVRCFCCHLLLGYPRNPRWGRAEPGHRPRLQHQRDPHDPRLIEFLCSCSRSRVVFGNARVDEAALRWRGRELIVSTIRNQSHSL